MNLLRFSVLAFLFLVPVCAAPAATYYVRTSGNNNNNGTSPSRAWKTIRKASDNVRAGDTVYVGGGTYQHGSTVIWDRSGTATSPIRLIADVTGARTGDAGDVIIRTPSTGSGNWTWNFYGGRHYQVTGFRFQRDPAAPASDLYKYGLLLYPTRGAPTANTSAYSFTNCTFENLYYDCYSVECPSATFTNCTSTGNKYTGLYMYRSGATVVNCTFQNQQYLPIYCIGPNTTCSVTDSLFTNSAAYGLYTGDITSLNSQNNVFTNCRYSLHGSAGTVTVNNCTFSLTDAFSRANWGNWGVLLTSPTHGPTAISNSTISGYQVGAYIMSNDVAMTNVNITGMGTNYYNADWSPNSNWRDSYGIYPYGYPNGDGTWSYCKRFKYTGSSGTLSGCYVGIYSESADLTVENATIAGQMYGVYSTGNYSPGNNLTITGSTIRDCLWNGMGVWHGASVTATNSRFLNNGVNLADGGWSWGWGAYIYGYKNNGIHTDGIPGDGALSVSDCEFTGNGDGLYIASFKKPNVTLAANTVDGGLVLSGSTPSSRFGWGVWLGNGDYELLDNAFTVQKCYYGIGTRYSTFVLKGHTVSNNYYGGYLYDSPSAEVATSTFSNNAGTGLYTSAVTSALVHDCQFLGNGNGGIFYNGNEIVRDCTFKNNAGNGLQHENSQSALTERVVAQGNGSWGYLAYGTQSALARNCVITGNANGAYLWDVGTGAQILNCTIANNTSWGGINAYAGQIVARNNIIAGNNSWGIHQYAAATLTHSHNLVYGHQPGTDYWKEGVSSSEWPSLRDPTELDKPPRFVNSGSGDFRLAKGSPAINAGLNVPGTVDNDMLGNARPAHNVTEIGAYEFLDPSGSVRIVEWSEKK